MAKIIPLQKMIDLNQRINTKNDHPWVESAPKFKELTGKELLEPIENEVNMTTGHVCTPCMTSFARMFFTILKLSIALKKIGVINDWLKCHDVGIEMK
jgi:hypothetical protein